jgi:hypothetical protein
MTDRGPAWTTKFRRHEPRTFICWGAPNSQKSRPGLVQQTSPDTRTRETLVRTKAFLIRDVAFATPPPIWPTLPAAWWGLILIHRQCETPVVAIAAPILATSWAPITSCPFCRRLSTLLLLLNSLSTCLMRKVIWWKCDAPSRRGAPLPPQRLTGWSLGSIGEVRPTHSMLAKGVMAR